MKFGEKLFERKLLSRLSHKVCRLLPSPVLLLKLSNYKQLLDEVFVISGIIKVEVRLRLITLTETLIIPDITKTESNNCFIIQAILIFFYRSHPYFPVRELDIAVRALDIAVRALDIALGNHALRV